MVSQFLKILVGCGGDGGGDGDHDGLVMIGAACSN